MKYKLLLSLLVGALLVLTPVSAQEASFTLDYSDDISADDSYSWTITEYSTNSDYNVTTSADLEADATIELEVLANPDPISFTQNDNDISDEFALTINEESVGLTESLIPGIDIRAERSDDTGSITAIMMLPLIYPVVMTFDNGTTTNFIDYILEVEDNSATVSEDGDLVTIEDDGDTVVIDKQTGLFHQYTVDDNWGSISYELNEGFLQSLPISPLLFVTFVPLVLIRRIRQED